MGDSYEETGDWVFISRDIGVQRSEFEGDQRKLEKRAVVFSYISRYLLIFTMTPISIKTPFTQQNKCSLTAVDELYQSGTFHAVQLRTSPSSDNPCSGSYTLVSLVHLS